MKGSLESNSDITEKYGLAYYFFHLSSNMKLL